MSTDVPLLPDPNQLPDDPAALKKIIAGLCQVVQQKTARIEQLEHQMDLLVKRLLQPSSEKIDPRQLALFADLDSGDPQVPPAEAPPKAPADNHEKPPRRRDAHGRRRPPHTLEREILVHDLSDAEKAALGGVENLVCIGEDITCTYEWRAASLFIVEHHQKKYTRTENATVAIEDVSGIEQEGVADQPTTSESNAAAIEPLAAVAQPTTEGAPAVEQKTTVPELPTLSPAQQERLSSTIITAAKPPLPIPGGMAEAGLLAYVLVSKYVDHLPLYRLEKIFKRYDVPFSRQTLWNWCAGCGELLSPLSDLLREQLLESFVVHTDDTPVKLRDAFTQQKCQARFWVYVGDEQHPFHWFDFTTTRKRAGPDKVLKDYTGYLQADGYGAYDDYEGLELGADSPILKVACWAHARRKFHDAKRTEPVRAMQALAQIGQLYTLERTLRERSATEWADLPTVARAELIAAERQAHAVPVIERFKKWLQDTQLLVLPKSPLAAAIRYAQNQWDALCRYPNDGRLAIDNNLAERALRHLAIGRKNWLFCGSEAGGRTMAVLLSVISSAQRNGLEPWSYLKDVLTRLAELRAACSLKDRDELKRLLPNCWKPKSSD